ncbi:MAG: hypothetical protein AAGI23_05725 [Bacteroidota bacterium]
MRNITFILLFLFPVIFYAQSEVIIETSKPLCMMSFLETASFSRSVSVSYYEYIMDELEQDAKFISIVQRYKDLKLEYSHKREEYPKSRHIDVNTKDLLWIAAANASDIEDFSQRIISILPNVTHTQLIATMTEIEPYYDEMIWEKEQENIKRVEAQLTAYLPQIGQLFLKAKQFYDSAWDDSIPFKISLCPIPLTQGATVSLCKGNILICSFLSQLPKEDKGLVGVVIHEMCHLLYDEQTAAFQHELEGYFTQSESAYNRLAYGYINEGLATAIGNGWGYEQLYGTLDTTAWYNDVYIDGFAHALLPLVDQYMQQHRSIDNTFVQQAIEAFGTIFPKSIYETAVLMNAVHVFTNTDEEKEMDVIMDGLMSNYRVTSMWLSSPIDDEKSKSYMEQPQTTKVVVIDSDQKAALQLLADQFDQPKLAKLPLNSFYTFQDEATESSVLIFVLENLEKLTSGVAALKTRTYLDFDKGFEF